MVLKQVLPTRILNLHRAPLGLLQRLCPPQHLHLRSLNPPSDIKRLPQVWDLLTPQRHGLPRQTTRLLTLCCSLRRPRPQQGLQIRIPETLLLIVCWVVVLEHYVTKAEFYSPQ
jgi:hypothetical protein